jgi:hypothetical protein
MHEKGLFLNDWRRHGLLQMKTAFGLTTRDLKGAEILLASYSRGLCQGEAFVLFLRDGTLYEVNACHHSDQLLEGQWDPEDTNVQALRHRLEHGQLGRGESGDDLFASELLFLLTELELEFRDRPR